MRVNSPFLSTNSALNCVRAGPGSTQEGQGSGEFLYGRPCSPSVKDLIQLQAFPWSSIKSLQPEADELLHL